LETESVGIFTSTTATHPKSRVKIIVVVSIIAVSVVFGALLVSAFISAPPQGQDAWLFKGAYATYKGSTSISAEDIGIFDMSLSIDFDVRQEVVDFNSTHVLVSTSYQMSSSFGEFNGGTEGDEKSAWVPLSEIGLTATFEDLDLASSFESTVNIDGFGTRTCIVYEYAISNEGIMMTVYVDKMIEWPLKMELSMTNANLSGVDLELEINLEETNIPALESLK